MTTSTDRRQFMRQSAGSLILGFPILSASKAQTAELLPYPRHVYPGLLGLAMKRMADECKPGVVFLIHPDYRNQLLSQSLASLLLDGSAEAKRLFGQAIFVCVPLAEAQAAFPAQNDSMAVLLDPNGRPFDDLKQQAWPQRDASIHITHFLHGPHRKHLAEFVRAQRQALDGEALASIEVSVKNCSADDFRVREAATRLLVGHCPRASAILADAHLRGDAETRYRIDLVFDRYYLSLADTAGERLPFGVEWFDQTVDPCPFCGQVAFNPQLHRAVKALRWTQK